MFQDLCAYCLAFLQKYTLRYEELMKQVFEVFLRELLMLKQKKNKFVNLKFNNR